MRSGENDDFVVILSMFEALKGRLRNDHILSRFLHILCNPDIYLYVEKRKILNLFLKKD